MSATLKLFVGTLPFEGKVHAPTVASLIEEQAAAGALGVSIGAQIISGAHYVAEGYNLMISRFLRTDFDKIAFVEHDVSWAEPGCLAMLAKIPHHYVGGITRMKHEPEEYMLGLKAESDLRPDAYGCIEAAWIPQGFTVASRAMIQALWDAASGREYRTQGELVRQVFFEDWRPEWGKVGQDIGICYDWQAMGGKVHAWLPPTLTHTAAVNHSYTGCLADWMAREIPRLQPGETLKPLWHSRKDAA